jgi:hypothetical protein
VNKQETLRWLHQHLQTAIMLEYATLPPYLTALWSIHGDSEHARTTRGLILSIIQEEMLHMSMACNVLNAIGGRPRLNDPMLLPFYPCMLPGHSKTNNAFLVHLNKCCPQSIANFVQIELPHAVTDTPHHEDGWSTIGEFYDEIEELLKSDVLDESDFTHGRQISSDYNPGKGTLYTVHSRQDALTALDEIIDQGEGHTGTKYDADGDLTHYWKFVAVHDLMINGDWKYQDDVYDVTKDPHVSDFAPEALRVNQLFNEIFSDLLDAMQHAFTSEAPSLDESIRLMFQLKEPAQYLMQIPLVDKEGNSSPTFEYVTADMRTMR